MRIETKIASAVGLAVALILLVLYLSEPVGEQLRPEPVAAHVAVEIEGRGLAEDGVKEIEAGQPFRLYAVVEARTWNDRTVYYTEAPRLSLEGREVPRESLRRWDRPEETRVLWFSVEGTPPYLELSRPDDRSRLAWREIYRSDWPNAWSIPGSIESSREAAEERLKAARPLSFGTQRFHVRIETFGPESRIRPRKRVSSLAAETLPGSSPDFATVAATLPEPLRESSRVFGLTQIEPLGGLEEETAVWLAELFERGLTFSRPLLMRGLLSRSGRRWEELEWRPVEINGESPWGGEGMASGDLLRAGDRLVVLYEDRGTSRVLDEADLCFDFFKGAAVRRLDEVFSGDGLLEWTRP